MSSNMYGFEVYFDWQGRHCFAQIVFKGTGYDDESTLEHTYNWESTEPIELAKYELQHRKDWNNSHGEVRISVWSCYSSWLDEDEIYKDDPEWNPPTPTEREVLEIIASGNAEFSPNQWDT